MPKNSEGGQVSKSGNHSNPAEEWWWKPSKVSCGIPEGRRGEGCGMELTFCGHSGWMKSFKLGWSTVRKLVQGLTLSLMSWISAFLKM